MSEATTTPPTVADESARVWAGRARHVQLALAVLWLLDGGLQFQSFMYSKGFPQMLIGASSGQPGWVVDSVTWAAHQAGSNLTIFNTLFALVQVALGLLLLHPRTVKLGLAGSIAWAAGVWWFGESFGQMLSTAASPLTGAPGAVALYALLALIAWPNGRPAGLLGRRATLVTWTVLWSAMAWLWLTTANSRAITDMINAAPSGMSWITQVQDWAAQGAAGNSVWLSFLLAALSLAIAIGVLIGWQTRRLLIAAVVLNLLYWLLGQGFGGIFQGGATDPNAGPLWILFAYAVAGLVPTRRAARVNSLAKGAAAAATAAVITGCAPAIKPTAGAGSMNTNTGSGTTATSGTSSMNMGGASVSPAPAVGGIKPVPTQILGKARWQGMAIIAQAMTPVPFVVFDGTTSHLVKPTKDDSFHLMVKLQDAETAEPIPYAGVWATIRHHGRIVFDERQWPMISRYMGPHYGNDVALPGYGHYQLTLLISPPVSARHLEYEHMWQHPHRVVMNFDWSHLP